MKTIASCLLALLVLTAGSVLAGTAPGGDGGSGGTSTTGSTSQGTNTFTTHRPSQRQMSVTVDGGARNTESLNAGEAAPITGNRRSMPPTVRRGNAAGYSFITDTNGDGVLDPPAATLCTESSCGAGSYESVANCQSCNEPGCSARGVVVNGACACDRTATNIRYMCQP
mgnify:CR=1 FL=1